MTDQLVTQTEQSIIESVVISGDLSKLTSQQRVSYYQKVCSSLGLNPFTRPFDYITLNGKLTLYAKKDATDQLRNIHSVSIDDVDIVDTATQYIVKVKGHNKDGRTDVEIGVVNKSDMQGNLANAQMKAVTKGKRRLTLSLCGLGWLDETEVETIPDAKRIVVTETGEILPNNGGHSPDADASKLKPLAKPEPATDAMTIDQAETEWSSTLDLPYGMVETEQLQRFDLGLSKAKKALTAEQQNKRAAIAVILDARSKGRSVVARPVVEPEPERDANGSSLPF